MKRLWKLTLPAYIIVVLPMIIIRIVELIFKGYHLYTIEENKYTAWLFKWADKLGFDDVN